MAEPALHPECLAYARLACPMLNGNADTYRSSGVPAGHPVNRSCADPQCPCPKAPSSGTDARAGAIAEGWACWFIDTATAYRIKTTKAGVVLGLDLNVPVLRIRVIRRASRPDLETLMSGIRELLGLEQPPAEPPTAS
ncbi:hypothetical protein ACWD01_33565 [Streptomyces sp. NPDC002835]